MDEYIKRETAVRMVMAAKWGDGSDGAMAMEIVASAPPPTLHRCGMGGGFMTRKPNAHIVVFAKDIFTEQLIVL